MDILVKNKVQLRVRYAETDQMGYCYYGNYAQYFEVGRVEAMRSIGMSYKELENKGIMLPVSELNITYLTPAKYDDELTITTYVTAYKGARLYFEYEIHNEENALVAQAKTTLIFVAKDTMKPIRIPDFFIDLLENN